MSTLIPEGARRVLIVSSELPPGPGGIGAHAYAVAVELDRQGRDVALLACQHYTTAAERRSFNSASPVPITTLPDRPDPIRTALARRRLIAQSVAAFRPDVIVASGGRILWLADPVARRLRIPMTAVVHGTELGGARWQRALTLRTLRHAPLIVAVSDFTADLTRRLGVEGPIEVIPNGAEAERFRPSSERRRRFRERHGLADRPVVLTVGNVTERKGQHLVVEALPQVVAAVPDVAYVVVGRPTDGAALMSRAAGLGVRDHLFMVGQVAADEVIDAHAAADVFAMTSTTTSTGDVEGFGIAVVEAALSGVPAVVTRRTGAEEAIVDGETGVAVEGTGNGVAVALTNLLTDDGLRTRLGSAAERRARAEGSWRDRVARYGTVLDQVARGERPRILVVSHTEHHRHSDGSLVGFGPTLRELDHLATAASELVHVAPIYGGDPPPNALAPASPNIRTVTVRAAGGSRLADKVRAAAAVPAWARTINREASAADIVHVRCPAGISMVALAVLAVRRYPTARWVKFAGNWRPAHADSPTYAWQRWWLRGGHAKASVTVNGTWPHQPGFVRDFDNPTLTDEELALGQRAAEERPAPPPWRLVFVGRVDAAKGADRVLDAVTELVQRGHDVRLDVVGDGPLRADLEAGAARDLAGRVSFHGWTSRVTLEQVLAVSHLLLLPSQSEGFPKVVAEALAFGCVPLASDVSSIGQVLAQTGGGLVVPTDGSWSDAAEGLITQPKRWAALSLEGPASAARFGYRSYLGRVRKMAAEDWRMRV